MTCKDCIHSGVCYKENDYANFPDKCGSFIHDRLQGKWIYDTEHSITIDMYKCSVCGCDGHTHFNFCPNCGADMRGE